MRRKVEKIMAHNCNVFINRQLIYNYPEKIFADAGIMAIEHADFLGNPSPLLFRCIDCLLLWGVGAFAAPEIKS